VTISRYDGAVVRSVNDGIRGPVNATYAEYVVTLPTQFTLYSIQPGDRWDKIANRFFGDVSLWWRIADINPELFDQRAIRPGVIIRVPAP
jgi:nucleoid-associated protein YgaU